MNNSFQYCCYKTIFLSLLFFSFIINTKGQTQTSTKITKTIYKVGTNVLCGGYLESLPVDYASNPTKKYPLLVFVHGAGEIGDGSQAKLTKLDTTTSLPRLISKGNFPTSFNLSGENFSFIVVSPQAVAVNGNYTHIQAMIDTALQLYRVDTTRIYLTGLSYGGRLIWDYMRTSSSANKVAASLLICPNSISSMYTDVASAAGSNVPLWVTHNANDPSAPRKWSDSLIKYYNGYSPIPAPPAKLNMFQSGSHDAWTRTYNPDSSWDGMNVYQWLLQYTNEKLVAKAGPDQTFSSIPANVMLDGSKSHARQGRIANFSWTKITGPSGDTITQDSNGDTAIVSGLTAGLYSYKLTITHTNGSTKSDTININISSPTQTQTKQIVNISSQIKGFWESLPLDYSATSKKYPLIIYLDGAISQGDSVSLELDTIAQRGLPRYINDGLFPSSFTVDGKSYSFIVLSPQYKAYSGYTTWLPAMVQYAINNYRVDTSRIYVTGRSLGGRISWHCASTNDTLTRKLAAEVLVCPNSISDPINNAAAVVIPAASNLPIWALQNYDDPVGPRAYLTTLSNNYNTYTPNPDPLMKVTFFTGAEQPTDKSDAWTRAYNPATKVDSMNVYEWMLQFTNDRLTANAGPDQTFTTAPASITLDGSRSHGRQGRISYAWAKIAGPSSGTLTPVGNGDTATVTGISIAGTYSYALTITHTNGSTKSDTVNVTINATPPTAFATGGHIQLNVDSIILYGGGTASPGSSIVSYAWTKVSGPSSYTFVTPSASQTKVRNLAEGSYVFQLTVTDANGLTASANAGVWVYPYSTKPKAIGIGGNITLPKDSILLRGGSSRPASGSSIASYSWIKYSGPSTYTLDTPSGSQTWAKNLVVGIYVFKLIVNDINGTSDTTNVQVIVYPEPSPRTANKEQVELTVPNTNDTAIQDVVLNPNPVHTHLTVWISDKLKGKTSITIYSVNGQRISQLQFIKAESEKTGKTINVSGLKSGTYFVAVTVGGKYKRTLKFIKY